MNKENPHEDEDKFPRDFDLPMDDSDPEDGYSQVLQDILNGRMDSPSGDIRLSPEDFIIVSSTLSLYSSYVSYVKEMDEALHRRAVEFSSDTVDLHPNVVLTDADGNPIGRFAEQAEETDDDEDTQMGI